MPAGWRSMGPEGNGENAYETENNQLHKWPMGHQLADEFCGLKCGHIGLPPQKLSMIKKADRKILLYVTSHYELPRQDFSAASDQLLKRIDCPNSQQHCSRKFFAEVYWSSWRYLSKKIRSIRNRGYEGYSNGEKNLLRDMLKILERRKLMPFALKNHRLVPLQVYRPIYGREIWAEGSLYDVKPYESIYHNGLWTDLITLNPYSSIFKDSLFQPVR
jgi:hypothetical protein